MSIVEQEYLKKHGLIPVKTIKIKSRTKKGVWYEVKLYDDGKTSCECEAGEFRRDCHHQQEAREQWYDSEGWRYNL